jgi:hypothetical protein
MMLSRSLLTVSLLAGASSSPAAAQFNPSQQQSTDYFKIVSGGFSGYGTYGAKFYSMTGQPVIDVWCVDFLHYAATSWDGVNITRFDSSNLSNTRFGVLGLDQYLKAYPRSSSTRRVLCPKSRTPYTICTHHSLDPSVRPGRLP